MRVETDLNTNDVVYCLHNNRIRKGVLYQISMKIDHQHDNVHLFEYNIAFGKDDTTVPDEKSWSDQGLVKRYNIFKTIEEAKESLTDEKRLKKWS